MTPALADKPRGFLDTMFFPLASPLRLAVCRVVVVFVQCGFLYKEYTRLPGLLDQPEFVDPQKIIQWLCWIIPQDLIRTPNFMFSLWWITLVAGILAVIGWLTRPAVFLFAAGNWTLIAHRFSYGERHHPEALLCIFLMLLVLSPCNRALSVDAWRRKRTQPDRDNWGITARRDDFVWPLTTMQILIAIAYANAGICKLKFGGLEWLNGYTLQNYVFNDAMRWDCPAGIWLARQHLLCVILSYVTIIWEASFPLVIVMRRLMPIYLVLGLAMHVGIYFTQAAPFFQLMALYVVFINFDALARRTGLTNGSQTHRLEVVNSGC